MIPRQQPIGEADSHVDPLLAIAHRHLPELTEETVADQSCIPGLARDPARMEKVTAAVRDVPTEHRLVLGDARRLDFLGDGSVHLVVTSPPYWTLKRYRDCDGQLGHLADYDDFLAELRYVLALAGPTLWPT